MVGRLGVGEGRSSRRCAAASTSDYMMIIHRKAGGALVTPARLAAAATVAVTVTVTVTVASGGDEH